MRIHYLQHDPLVTISTIEEWAAMHQHTLTGHFVPLSSAFPPLHTVDFLIILGGRMGVYEEAQYPWLQLEKQFIQQAIAANKLILGICLGAQLIASALGANVYPHHTQEIGWWPVSFRTDLAHTLLAAFQANEMVFHFHGDTFDLPKGAQLYASSEACLNHAFIYQEQVVGLQFHPEVCVPSLHRLAAAVTMSPQPKPFVQTAAHFLTQTQYFEHSKQLMFQLLDSFAIQFQAQNKIL